MTRRVELLSGFEPAERMPGKTKTLVVILHGWRSSAARMKDLKAATRAALSDSSVVDLLVPDLPHAGLFSNARAGWTVKALMKTIDRIVEEHGDYERIVLVGHSMGATIARRLFLVAAGPLGSFRPEAPLFGEKARPWASRVSRIILLSAVNRGWQISERMSWGYSVLLNAVGLFGHLMPKYAWTPSIFDIRLGAPFIVQTRLAWLAYRRHSAEDRTRPLLIQLIGSQDDLVSPFDQVDIAVDGLQEDVQAADGRKDIQNVTQRSLYLLHLDETDHRNAIDFTGPSGCSPLIKARQDIAAKRRAAFSLALTASRLELSDHAADPDLLSDQVTRPDSKVQRTVFVMHGIRDDGFWTHRIAERIRATAATSAIASGGTTPGAVAFRAWTPTYGYFAMLPFMLPWIRMQKVEWFMDQYVAAAAQYPTSRFDYVGHSNGTYLCARALRDYADCRFDHVFFAGSVVRSDYDWKSLFEQGRLKKVHNVVATADAVVALLPKSVEWIKPLDLGGAGFSGFSAVTDPSLLSQCRFVAGGHGAGIVEGHWNDIAGFIVDGQPFKPRSTVPPIFGDRQSVVLRVFAWLRLTMTLIVLVFGFIPLWVLIHFLSWKVALVFLLYCMVAYFIVTRL